jgi:hypothetical protein
MTQFPSSLVNFSFKTNGQTIEATHMDDVQDEITALETKVGTDNSSVTTSLDYLIKNTSSDGGGHVQTAVVGGTGQTVYVKGDVLAAQSGSILGKLAVGTNLQFFMADSTQTLGVKWQTMTASVGGTGQVSYTKGDILVALNSSTLGKLAVGTDGQVLKVNSSTLSGLEWRTPSVLTWL